MKIAILIGTIITTRRREFNSVPNNNTIEQMIKVRERYWSSHKVITRKKYAIIDVWESIMDWIKYFSKYHWLKDNANTTIDVAHKYQKYRFWLCINTITDPLSYWENHATIATIAINNQNPANNLLYLIYISLWDIKIVKQSAMFFWRKSLMNISWSALAYIWSMDSLRTVVFLPSGIYDLL